MTRRQGLMAMFSASLLCLVLGSVHAFSVFLEPLEAQYSAPRSLVSLTYSLALAMLTLAVLFGHMLFARIAAGPLIVAICLLGAFGAIVAAQATSLTEVWIGYSLLFGVANGLGYSFGLQSAARANPGREGLAIGVVTAAYALGAAVSPVLFSAAMTSGEFGAAMLGLAVVLVIIAPFCAVSMRSAGLSFAVPPDEDNDTRPKRPIALLWICYGAGVAAGLMAIGHATGIASASGWRSADWITPTMVATFNMCGSFGGGWLVDRANPVKLLIGLPLVSMISLLALAGSSNGTMTLIGLALVGASYGAIIAVFPATITKMFGTVEGTEIYGKVFTAWGTAGLLAPWFAGALYDQTGGYAIALVLAAGLSIASTWAAYRLRRYEASPAEGTQAMNSRHSV